MDLDFFVDVVCKNFRMVAFADDLKSVLHAGAFSVGAGDTFNIKR